MQRRSEFGQRNSKFSITTVIATLGGIILLISFIGAGLYGCPQYSVYSRRLDGVATLRQQEFARKVEIEEAKAKKESAKLLAEAEVERAKGVAEANRIIGDSLKNNDSYLVNICQKENI